MAPHHRSVSDHRTGTVPPLRHPAQRQVLPIESPAGGHAPGEAADSGLLEVRDAEDIGSDDGNGVGGVHEEAVLPQNHVAVLARTREKQLTALLCASRLQSKIVLLRRHSL